MSQWIGAALRDVVTRGVVVTHQALKDVMPQRVVVAHPLWWLFRMW